MGAQIALFHVVSAIVIVVVVHIVLQQAFARPVDELGFLKIASYGAIAAIGVAMLCGALRSRRAVAAADHAHGHDHSGHDGHEHHAGCGHHHHDLATAWRTGGLLSLAVGLIPCSGAVLILVYCLANGLLLSGIMMAGSIALGMAITLASIGILAIHARQGALAVAGRSQRPQGALAALLGLAGPVLIILFGGVMLLGSL
jgi:ABC-type nickel/cobalt efflux system permease component RcnA